jgi:xylulose-5-phosphate/fructose-6-phosphate phosphoketolase
MGGTFRAHQVPLLVDPEHPDHVKQLKSWMKSYRPEELFDENGRLIPELAQLAPKGDRRMGVARGDGPMATLLAS